MRNRKAFNHSNPMGNGVPPFLVKEILSLLLAKNHSLSHYDVINKSNLIYICLFFKLKESLIMFFKTCLHEFEIPEILLFTRCNIIKSQLKSRCPGQIQIWSTSIMATRRDVVFSRGNKNIA